MTAEVTEPAVRSLTAENTNATCGTMRTFWRFTVHDGKISRFETGQR
jgi:hypothetical protein